MKNKIKIIITLVATLCLFVSAFAFTACGEETPKHEHAVYDVEGVPATCVSEGNVAYKHCIYCGQKFLDGKEVSEEDVIIPIDPHNHADLIEHEEVPATCVVDGVKAYKECAACGVMIDNEGNTVTAEDLTIKASGEHAFDGGNTCTLCDAYKIEYMTGKSVVVDGFSDIGIVPNSKGATHGTADKQDHFDALIAEKLTLATQTSTNLAAVYSSDDITLTYTGTGNTQCTFTRLCVGNDGEDYTGKFIFAFDISVASDTVVDRIGAKVADNTATVITENATQDKLLGARKDEENNPNRKLTPNATYRFVYLMETTEANQLVQIFVGSGSAKWTLSNLHVVLLPEESASGTVMSKMLYFGSNDMSGEVTPAPDPEPEPGESKSYLLADGTDFFKAESWRVSDSSDTTARTSSEIIDSEGNLKFTSDKASRINMFYVAQAEDLSWKHLGDKKENTDKVSSIYGTEYSYKMTVNASGGFNMLLLGAKTCCSMTEDDALGLFVDFAADGKVTFYHSNGNASETYRSWGEFSGSSNFKMNEENTVEFKITRVDGDVLVVSVWVNDAMVELTGTDTDGIFTAADGAFRSSGILTNTGMGQRFGVYPSEGNSVTISSLDFGSSEQA